MGELSYEKAEEKLKALGYTDEEKTKILNVAKVFLYII